MIDAFEEAVDTLRDQLGPDATALDAIETFIAERGFVGADARRARQGLLAEIEADAADTADNQSLRWFGYEEEFEGDLFGDLPRDGYRSVVEVLAAGLDITFNAEVVSVQIDTDGIRVTCADGSVETGTHAGRHRAARRAQAGESAIRSATADPDAGRGRRAGVRPLREDRAPIRDGILARGRHLALHGVPLR